MAKYREYAYKQKVIQNISDFEVYLPGSDFINTQLYFHESRLRMFYYPKNSNPSDVLIEEGKNKSNFDPNTGCVTPNSINYQVQCSVMATPKGNQIYWDAVGSSGVYADGTPTKGYNAYVIKNGTTIFIQYTYFSTNINPENDLIKLVDSLTRIESEKVNPTYNCWRYFDPFCQDHSPAEMW